MIQDISPHRLKNEYMNMEADDEDILFSWQQGKILLKTDPETHTLEFPHVSDLDADRDELIYLFTVDEEHFFLYRKTVSNIPEGFAYAAFWDIRREHLEPREYVYALFTGYHLANWYDSSRYCGKCGAKTEHHPQERAMVCPECGNVIYPRINPAVIVGVISGEKLLITRYREGYGGSALIAGFTEIGETLEETAAREVYEETGLRVRNIRYYKSQPWGPAADILAGYYCEADGDETIRMDERELRYAAWVNREDIILQSNDYSLTNEMMQQFKEGKI